MRASILAVPIALSVLAFGAAHATTDPAAVLEACHAASGGDAWNAKAVMKTELAVSGQGLTGNDTSIVDLRTGYSVDHFKLGPASGAQGFDGRNAWQQGPNGAVNIQKGGDALPLAIKQACRNANLRWRPDFGGATVRSAGQKQCGASTCTVLTIKPKGGVQFEAWFDTKSHILERTVERVGAQATTVTLTDYRSVDGVVIPYQAVVDSGHGKQYLQTATVTSVTFPPAHSISTYAPPKTKVDDFSIAHGASETAFPFHLLNNHIYVDAWINGHGPLRFIVDTGGQNILLPATAEALGIKTQGAMPGVGVGNKAQDFGLAKVATLRVGDAVLKNQLVGVLDFIPNGVEGVDIKGMVGFTTFKRFVTRIDYGNHTMTLIDPKHFYPKDAGIPIPFVFNGNTPEVEGAFDGIPAKFDIDTGARDELTLTAPFARQHHLRASHPKGVVAVEGWGVGGASRGYVTRSRELAIGSVKIPDVVTSLSLQTQGAFASPRIRATSVAAF